MTEQEQRLVRQIKDAFAGVILGKGIGLWEGNAIDDYADDAARSECRQKDERENWSAISVDDLNFCHCCLSYLDAEGMRFLLPAYLVADLERTLTTVDILFHLGYQTDSMKRCFEILSPAQRAVIREHLLLRQANPDYEFHFPLIESALNVFLA